MDEHETGTNARSSRRWFLGMGTGLVGSLSLSSVLTACGSLASQAPPSQAPAAAEKEAIMTAQSNSYLIVAKYNYGKWRALVQRKNEDVANAERAAERLFPEEKTPLFSKDDPPKPFRPGLEFVGTFASDIFDRLPPRAGDYSPQEKVGIMDPIIEKGLPNPPAGWLAIMDQGEVAAFIQDMSSMGGHLWEMYDIDIRMLPETWTKEAYIDPLGKLNDDETTRDVYLNMSIRSWS